MSSYFQYGGTQFPDDELNLAHIDARLVLSPRGKRKEQVVTWYLVGQIFDTGASLVTSINARRASFPDYQTASFYSSAGVLAHQLDNASSVTGVHVLRNSFPDGSAAELATQRTYGITLQATYPAAESELLYFQEQLEFIGTTAPDVIWTVNGPVSSGIPNLQTMIQYGYAQSYSGYYLPPGPLYPNYEDQRSRMVRPVGGRMRGQVVTDFGMIWRYVHHSYTPLDTIPNQF